VVIGAVARDDVIRLTEPLRAGAHLSGALVEARLGGGGANTAVALAAAGHAVTLLAAVGRDDAGDALLVDLAATGVDPASISRLDRPTTRSLLLIDPTGERTVVNVARCEEDTPPNRLLELPADAVYVRSRRHDLGPLLAVKAATALVVAHVPPVVPNARPAQVLVASSSDLAAEAIENPRALGQSVSGGLARWVVITAGAAGARAYSAAETLATSARRVQPVDTTGAGDAFAAGLIHALIGGQPMAKALAMAVRFGTEAALWPTSGLPASAVHRLLREGSS
jgi:sugar/nucleoside kinase (ribokinase family)